MREPPEDWIVPDWPAPTRVRALVTTRNGGASTGPYTSMNLGQRVGDDPATVDVNRHRLRSFLPAEPNWLHQVHGARVVRAEDPGEAREADGVVTTQANCVCPIMIADCMPVLFADRAGGAIGAAHAGWRGLAAGVLENTVSAMGVVPANLVAWLGPAIGPSAFEVGSEVRDAFIAIDPAAETAFRAHGPEKWLADLFLLARQRLARAGVNNVFGGGLCTYSDPTRFFSHRRDKVSGRMAALIWME
jgi:YfiH family protein